MTKSKDERRVTARKYQGDDQASWAVFIDGRPFVTGLTRSEVPYYRRQALGAIHTGHQLAVNPPREEGVR